MSTLEIGDRVKVLKFGARMSGRIGLIRDQHENGRMPVAFDDGDYVAFDPTDLEKIPSYLE